MTIYTKLFEIQKLALAVSKDGKNPHFNSAYPTLDNVISVVVPEANKIGLLITHFVDGDHLVTRVVDTESGESLDSKFQMIGTTPQQRGSEQTYFRRYSMMALFNLPCEDDDGNVAQTTRQETKEYIKSHNIDALLNNIKEWAIVCTDADEAIKIASEKYIVADWAKKEIKEKWKTIFI